MTYRILRHILDQIEQDNSFAFIRDIILKHKSCFSKVISTLQNIEPLIEYNKTQKVNSDFHKFLNLPDNLTVLSSRADGNCLYNSLSYLFFNDHDLFYILKICSIYILIENEAAFIRLMKKHFYQYKFNGFVCQTARRSEWGNELNILSLAILLKRNIFVYSESSKSSIICRTLYQGGNKEAAPIFIGHSHNHFFPILSNSNIIKKEKKTLNETKFIPKELLSSFKKCKIF